MLGLSVKETNIPERTHPLPYCMQIQSGRRTFGDWIQKWDLAGVQAKDQEGVSGGHWELF